MHYKKEYKWRHFALTQADPFVFDVFCLQKFMIIIDFTRGSFVVKNNAEKYS